MLRSLNLKRIFIMIRPRKGTTIEKRTQDTIFSSPVFEAVWEQKPYMKEKVRTDFIVPVAGDLIMEGLGISQALRARIVNEVDVLINCAASVNFDDPLLDAI
jgi:hypothetical protein